MGASLARTESDVAKAHFVFCSCPFMDESVRGGWLKTLVEFCGQQTNCHYAIVDSTVAKLVETNDSDFKKAWKATVLRVCRNLQSRNALASSLF